MGGILSGKVEFKVLEECQKHVEMLDAVATGLAESLDAMTKTAGMLKQHYSDNTEDDKNDKVFQYLKELMECLEGSVTNQKLALLQTLSKFAEFAKSKSDDKTRNHVRALQKLKINDYIMKVRDQQNALIGTTDNRHFEGNQSAEPIQLSKMKKEYEEKLVKQDDIIKTTKAELESTKSNYEIDLKHLQEANKEIVETKNATEQILKEKEENNENLQQVCNKQQETIEQLKVEVTRLHEQLNPKIVILPVQIYFQRKSELMETIATELGSLLNDSLKKTNKEMQIIRCDGISNLKDNEPILVLCLHGTRLGTDAGNEIQGIKDASKAALLIFHHRDEHAQPHQTSDRILTDAKFKALGGIFDLAFLTGRGIYPCQMNASSATGITNFITKSV